ncbi:MAG: hypothetical protein WCI77_01865 [Candidatus Omnitrophota bacterium]
MDSKASLIMVAIDKKEISSQLTNRIEAEVNRRVEELVRYGESLRSLHSDADRFNRIVQDKDTLSHIANIDIVIDGYNNDPRELEEISEVVDWTRAWMRNQPYAPYFLSWNGLSLLFLLFAGGIRIGNRRFPDMKSEHMKHFFDILEKGLQYLTTQYGYLYSTLPFVTAKFTAIELHLSDVKKKLNPWWKIWNKI